MELNVVEAGSGPPLVLLHGLFGSARNFATVQRRLAAHWRVLALDLRNHGASPHAPGMQYAAQATDVLETLGRHDALPAAIVGHSMGGKVAMRLGLEVPASVSRLAVCDIAPVAYPPHFREYARAMGGLALAPGLTRAASDAALAPAVPDRAVRAFLLQNLTFGARPAWRIGLAEIAAGLPDIEGWAAPPGARYEGPALFLKGERSDYVRPEHRPAIRALFPATRIVTLKDAGHWLHADNPDGFVGAITSFLLSDGVSSI